MMLLLTSGSIFTMTFAAVARFLISPIKKLRPEACTSYHKPTGVQSEDTASVGLWKPVHEFVCYKIKMLSWRIIQQC